MEKEEFFKDETGGIYKTVEYEDGSMRPFVFSLDKKDWVNTTVGILTQAQWNGHEITREEAGKAVEKIKQGL